ncbi:hypothetical protein Ndes2526B_g04396 [Nannochloris sp. 'desiccata']
MITNVLKSAYDEAFSFVLKVVEHNIVPDPLVRAGIRSLLAQRAKESTPGSGEEFQEKMQAFVEELKNMPVAVETDAANEQHYEVPTEYFNAVLGPHRKYSSCLYPPGTTSLEDAEVAMLAMCSDRAELANGQNILELGCGWGSWSLYMAENFPGSTITAVSNSRTQKQYIDAQAKKIGLKNLTVITANVVEFKPPRAGNYDRVVSVEMFEHMKNYGELMKRISSWLRPGGKLFVHIFVHRIGLPYHYEVNGPDDWMTKYFFSGGTMPSMNLLLHFQEDLAVQKQWYVNGTHYSKTLEAWLEKHDKEKKLIMPLFEETYGKDQALKWFVYWRLFYLACSELFKYEHGERWGVGHYLFVKNKR